MKIKTLLFAFIAVLGLAVAGMAAEPMFSVTGPESTYGISHSTISISSHTAYTVAAVSRYRVLYVGDPDVTADIFYRADGSTSDIATVGDWIPAGAKGEIESNAAVSFQLGAGESERVVRLTEIRK